MSKETRFGFGRNWKQFSRLIDENRISEAVKSLQWMLRTESLEGRRFLDAGCGSGLFSLAAHRLGAVVHSFDYDTDSVECTRALRDHFGVPETRWRVEQGSVLDADYLRSLGAFDVVYSWGVLHHTGQMWRALELIQLPVAKDGCLFISIYNDQGVLSKTWRGVKKLYCSSTAGRWLVKLIYFPYLAVKQIGWDINNLRIPGSSFVTYWRSRGMSIYHDWIDWLGGYPFEYARPEEIFEFFRNSGFEMERLATTNSDACNQFVFRRRA